MGFESPTRLFLFNSKWNSSTLLEYVFPFTDVMLYCKAINEFKYALEKVGVSIHFGNGCDIIFYHHLQRNKYIKVMIKLYKYLQDSKLVMKIGCYKFGFQLMVQMLKAIGFT